MQTTLRILKKLLFKLHRLIIKFINFYTKLLKHPIIVFIRTVVRVSILLSVLLSYFLLYFYDVTLGELTDTIVAIAAGFSLLTSTVVTEIGSFFKGIASYFKSDSNNSDDGNSSVPPFKQDPVFELYGKMREVFGVQPRVETSSTASISLRASVETEEAVSEVQKGTIASFTQNHPWVTLTCLAVIAGGVYFFATADSETIKNVFTGVTALVTGVFSKDVTGDSDGTNGSARINDAGDLEIGQTTRFSGAALRSFLKKLNPFTATPAINPDDVAPGTPLFSGESTPIELIGGGGGGTTPESDGGSTPTPETVAQAKAVAGQVAAYSREELQKQLDDISQKLITTRELYKDAVHINDTAEMRDYKAFIAMQVEAKNKVIGMLLQLPRVPSEEELEWAKVELKRKAQWPLESSESQGTSTSVSIPSLNPSLTDHETVSTDIGASNTPATSSTDVGASTTGESSAVSWFSIPFLGKPKASDDESSDSWFSRSTGGTEPATTAPTVTSVESANYRTLMPGTWSATTSPTGTASDVSESSGYMTPPTSPGSEESDSTLRAKSPSNIPLPSSPQSPLGVELPTSLQSDSYDSSSDEGSPLRFETPNRFKPLREKTDTTFQSMNQFD